MRGKHRPAGRLEGDLTPSFDVRCIRSGNRRPDSSSQASIGRPFDIARVWRKSTVAAALALLALSMPVSPLAACSGAPVSFEQIRTGAERIVIASVVDIDTVDGVPSRVTLQVQSVLRGVSGPQVVLEPPTYMGCLGQMDEPIGTRLVVATGPHFFVDSPPQEMHPYWRVLPGDIVVPAGVDDPDPDHTRLAGLIAEFGGLPVPPVEPEPVVDPLAAPDPSPVVAVAIVVATMLAVAVLFGAVVIAARKRRPLR